MSEIKLVLTDIDGTIVSPGQHNPTPRVRKAIKDVQDAGVQLTAATGRPYDMAKGLFDELGFRGLSIFDGGASIQDVQTGEFAWKNWLGVDRLKHIAGIILPKCTEIDFFPVYKQVLASETSLADIIEPAPYVFAFVRAEARDDVAAQLLAMGELSVHVGPGRADMPGVWDFQITDINSDKYHAGTALRKIEHSKKEETLAIGDTTSDRPLYDIAGIKVAMGNAMQELKDAADYVVGTVEEDGWAEAMDRFVLAT